MVLEESWEHNRSAGRAKGSLWRSKFPEESGQEMMEREEIRKSKSMVVTPGAPKKNT